MQPSNSGLRMLRSLAYSHSAPCLAIRRRAFHSTISRSENSQPKISFGAEGDVVLASYKKQNTPPRSTSAARNNNNDPTAGGNGIIVTAEPPSHNTFFPPPDDFEIPSFIDRSKQPVARPTIVDPREVVSTRPAHRSRKPKLEEKPSPAATKLKERFARARERIEHQGTGPTRSSRGGKNTAPYSTRENTTQPPEPGTTKPHIAQPIADNPKIRLSGPRRPLEEWQIQRAALKRKFADQPWSPRKKLSPDALDGIRALHDSDPQKYSTPVLAEQFQVSPEAIRRILSSKWRPSEEEAQRRREAWARRHDRIWDHMAELGLRPPRKSDKKVVDEAEAADEFADELTRKRVLGLIE